MKYWIKCGIKRETKSTNIRVSRTRRLFRPRHSRLIIRNNEVDDASLIKSHRAAAVSRISANSIDAADSTFASSFITRAFSSSLVIFHVSRSITTTGVSSLTRIHHTHTHTYPAILGGFRASFGNALHVHLLRAHQRADKPRTMVHLHMFFAAHLIPGDRTRRIDCPVWL